MQVGLTLPLCAAGVTIEEVSDDQETAGAEAGGDTKDAGETTTPQEPPRALGLELVKSPQDGSADAVVSLVLGSSYVVYHAAALTRLQDFFRTEQVRGNCSAAQCAACNVVHGFYAHGCRAISSRPRSSSRSTWIWLDVTHTRFALPDPSERRLQPTLRKLTDRPSQLRRQQICMRSQLRQQRKLIAPGNLPRLRCKRPCRRSQNSSSTSRWTPRKSPSPSRPPRKPQMVGPAHYSLA